MREDQSRVAVDSDRRRVDPIQFGGVGVDADDGRASTEAPHARRLPEARADAEHDVRLAYERLAGHAGVGQIVRVREGASAVQRHHDRRFEPLGELA